MTGDRKPAVFLSSKHAEINGTFSPDDRWIAYNSNASGKDETVFLTEIEEIASSGVTAAERLLEKYYGPWKRDLRRAFAEARI